MTSHALDGLAGSERPSQEPQRQSLISYCQRGDSRSKHGNTVPRDVTRARRASGQY